MYRGETNKKKVGGARKNMMTGKMEKRKSMAVVLRVKFVMKNGRKRDLAIVYPRSMPGEEI